jgi:hypothetical protein
MVVYLTSSCINWAFFVLSAPKFAEQLNGAMSTHVRN